MRVALLFLVLLPFVSDTTRAQSITNVCTETGTTCREGSFCVKGTCYADHEKAMRAYRSKPSDQHAQGSCRAEGRSCRLYEAPGCCYPCACEIGPGPASLDNMICCGGKYRR
jgi:hypothetical protein